MLMILEGTTSQAQEVVSYIPVYSFGNVLSCIASICQMPCMYFWSSIHQNIFENECDHKIVDILISSSMQILE